MSILEVPNGSRTVPRTTTDVTPVHIITPPQQAAPQLLPPLILLIPPPN